MLIDYVNMNMKVESLENKFVGMRKKCVDINSLHGATYCLSGLLMQYICVFNCYVIVVEIRV